MAKFFYEVRVKKANKLIAQYIRAGEKAAYKKANKLIAQYIRAGEKAAYKKAITVLVKLSGANEGDIYSETGGIWQKSYAVGGYYAYVYQNPDGYDTLPSADTIGTEDERAGL